MLATDLISYFTNYGLDKDESAKIASRFERKIFKKGDYFVKEKKKSLQIGFVEAGQFQYFTVSSEGEERTTYISLSNTFVASLLSYVTETPSKENIRSLTNGILWIINKEDVIELQNQIPRFKDFYISLIEYQICCIDKSKFDLIMLTAEQRYKKILKEEPELLQQVPLQHIASMLGITQRHLSRLRKEI